MATTSTFTPVAKSELDFFRPRNVQITQLSYETIPLRPVTAIESDSRRLEFHHAGRSTEFYRNLNNTFLYLKFKVCTTAGAAVDETKEAGMINFIGNTWVKSVEISLNGSIVTRNTEEYGYRSYIESLLTSDGSSAPCHLAMGGFKLDRGENIDTVDSTTNAGFKERWQWVKDGKAVEVLSRLHSDIGNSNLYLPNGLDLSVTINLNSDDFILMCKSKPDDCVVKLLDAVLYVEIAHINPAVLTAHGKMFQDHNAILPIQHVEIRTENIPSGTSSVSIDNLVSGKLPSVLIIAMVDNDAKGGNRLKNALAFKHYDLKTVTCVLNGIPHVLGPLAFKETPMLYAKAYHALLRSTGLLRQGESPLITYDNFPRGFFMASFDFSSDGAAATHATHSSIARVGNLRVELLFDSPNTTTISVIFYMLFEGACIEIDKFRNVFVSY